MSTDQGLRVLEFNCRFGDPETQPLLMRLRTDLLDVLEAVVDDRLEEIELNFDPRPAMCVVVASQGYPGPFVRGKRISGLEEAAKLPDVQVFHAGTKVQGGHVFTDGGRVFGVTALGESVSDARSHAYAAIERIHFPGMAYRRDIGVEAPTPAPA
jgi:phosphoribosylamine--glycine ligase